VSPLAPGVLAYITGVGENVDGTVVTVISNDGDVHRVTAQWITDAGASWLNLPRANLRPIAGPPDGERRSLGKRETAR